MCSKQISSLFTITSHKSLSPMRLFCARVNMFSRVCARARISSTREEETKSEEVRKKDLFFIPFFFFFREEKTLFGCYCKKLDRMEIVITLHPPLARKQTDLSEERERRERFIHHNWRIQINTRAHTSREFNINKKERRWARVIPLATEATPLRATIREKISARTREAKADANSNSSRAEERNFVSCLNR